jgi:fluoroquinolone transport system permease protein
MKQLMLFATTDFKLIFRDPSLRVFLVLPAILFALIIWTVPSLIENYDFLIPYLPVFLAIAVIENTQMFCFISSMVLIDEKETDVAKVYGIVPLTKSQFILSRMLIPFLFTTMLNVLLLAIQPFYQIGFGDNLIISFLAAMVVPVYVLAINSIVKNRMQGMVYIKAFNMIVILPIAAFFIPDNLQYLFGVLPTHWIFLSVENLSNGLNIATPAMIGFVFITGLLWFFAQRFFKVHFT